MISKLPPNKLPGTLRLIGRVIVDHPAWQQRPDGTTWCNHAVDFVARLYGYNGFSGERWPLLANDMHRHMVESDQWQEIALDEIKPYLLHGCLIVTASLGEENGHVCVPMPVPFEYSGNYRAEVPVYANVGPVKYTGFRHLGWCIGPERSPKHFLYTGA